MVHTLGSLMSYVEEGTRARKTASTLQNPSSSRSHALLTIAVAAESQGVVNGVTPCFSTRRNEISPRGGSKLRLVDLAGSESAATCSGVHRLKVSHSLKIISLARTEQTDRSISLADYIDIEKLCDQQIYLCLLFVSLSQIPNVLKKFQLSSDELYAVQCNRANNFVLCLIMSYSNINCDRNNFSSIRNIVKKILKSRIIQAIGELLKKLYLSSEGGFRVSYYSTSDFAADPVIEQ